MPRLRHTVERLRSRKSGGFVNFGVDGLGLAAEGSAVQESGCIEGVAPRCALLPSRRGAPPPTRRVPLTERLPEVRVNGLRFTVVGIYLRVQS